jgi:predicted membrane channel-forming protein YqfA (hemolysin III family)
MSCLKTSLLVSVILAFFLGIFDLTLYSALTSRSGGNGFVVFLGTMLSVLPSVAGYLALKEGSFRKYSSLKKFDQLVFGNVAWFILGIYSLLLATLILFSPWPPAFAGTVLLLLMQLILGVLMILHPILRGRLSAPNVTYPY